MGTWATCLSSQQFNTGCTTWCSQDSRSSRGASHRALHMSNLWSPAFAWWSGLIIPIRMLTTLPACLPVSMRNPKCPASNCSLELVGPKWNYFPYEIRSSKHTSVSQSCRDRKYKLPNWAPKRRTGWATPASTLGSHIFAHRTQSHTLSLIWNIHYVLEDDVSWLLNCAFDRLFHHSVRPAAVQWHGI